MNYQQTDFRREFIKNALWFAQTASKLPDVLRIALIGSITTPKLKPKDVDLLITLADNTPIKPVADLGRKLLGKQMAVGDSSGADIFIASEKGAYLGRTCQYRDCFPRMSCEGSQCNGSYLCNDFHRVNLKKELIANPPVELFPTLLVRAPLPKDLVQALESWR
jgi:hypothetical protein